MKANGMIRRVTLASVARRRSSILPSLRRTVAHRNTIDSSTPNPGSACPLLFVTRGPDFQQNAAMEPDVLRAQLVGPIAFPVTPFRDDLSLDLAGLGRNVEMLLEHPPAAMVAPGGTGEMYSLTPAEHRQVVEAVVAKCRGRVPVIAGVGFNAAIAADLARDAARAGAEGILAFPPYYPNPDDDGVVE